MALKKDKEVFDKYDLIKEIESLRADLAESKHNFNIMVGNDERQGKQMKALREEADEYRNIIQQIKHNCPVSVQRRIDKHLSKYPQPTTE